MAQKRRPTSYFSFNDDSILFYLVCVSPLRLKNLFPFLFKHREKKETEIIVEREQFSSSA